MPIWKCCRRVSIKAARWTKSGWKEPYSCLRRPFPWTPNTHMHILSYVPPLRSGHYWRSESPRESLRRAVELGKRPSPWMTPIPPVYAMLTFPYLYLKELISISEAEKAISSAPNSALAYWALGPAPQSFLVGLKRPFPCSKNPFVSAHSCTQPSLGPSGPFI